MNDPTVTYYLETTTIYVLCRWSQPMDSEIRRGTPDLVRSKQQVLM